MAKAKFLYYYKGELIKSSTRGTYRYALYDTESDNYLSFGAKVSTVVKDMNYYKGIAARDLEHARKRNDEKWIKIHEEELAYWDHMEVREIEVKEI